MLAVAIALGAAAPAPAQPPPERVDPGIEDGSAQRALDAARERWRDAGSSSYRYRLRLACFCQGVRFETIVVRRGRPVRAPAHLRHAATVPRLHRIVQEAIDDRSASLEVSYGRHGVPRTIAIDRSVALADDELTYDVRRFRRKTERPG